MKNNVIGLCTIALSIFLSGCVSGPVRKKSYLREPDKRPDYSKEQMSAMKQEKLGRINERIGLIIAPGQYQNNAYSDSSYIQESFEMVLSAMDDKFDYVYYTPVMFATGSDNAKTINRCLRSCGKNTLLVVFLAGNVVLHDSKYYLLNYDTNPADISGTALDLCLLFKELDKSGCGRILVFSDLYPQVKAPGQLIKYLAGLPAFKNKYDLSREMRLLVTNYSANGKPYKFYIGFQGADIFSWFLTLGLRNQADKIVNGGNNDGKTSVGELTGYINEEMSGAMVYKQKPAFTGNFSPETTVLK